MSVVNLQNIEYTMLTQQEEELTILKDVNLHVNSGEFHVITGPSGSGKTTLLQIIGTLLHPTKGDRKLFSKKLNGDSSHELLIKARSRIGYLFQSPFLPANLQIQEFVELQASLSGIGYSSAMEKAKDLLNQFNISQFSKNFPTTLSGGERQRVALASVLAQDVELLLLDEPTGSLDSENSQLVWDSIKQLKDSNLTIIAVSHDKEITELANKSHILDYGIIKPV